MAKKNKSSLSTMIDSSMKSTAHRTSKKAPEEILRKERLRLEEIKQDRTYLEGDIYKLSSGLRDILAPEVTALPESPHQISKATDNNQNVLHIYGDSKKNQSIERVINKTVGEQTARVSMFNTTGVYRKIMQANDNEYLEEQLPILQQSAELFIDDVNNGSYRGSNFDTIAKFRFFGDDGQEVTKTEDKQKLVDILCPKDLTDSYSDERSFFDIDKQSDYIAWKHGVSFTRIINNKDVAKDLYVKYVMKTKKAQELSKKKESKVMLTVPNQSMESVSNIIQQNFHMGLETVHEDTIVVDDLSILDKNIDNVIEARVVDYVTLQNGKKRILSQQDKTEIKFANESFESFCERWLNDELVSVFESGSVNHKNYFNVNHGGYTQASMREIVSQIVHQDDSFFQSGMESIQDKLGLEDVLSKLDTTIEDMSFDDIYNFNHNYRNSNTRFAYESILTNLNQPFSIGMEDALGTFRWNHNILNQASDTLSAETGAKQSIEEQIKSDNQKYGKLERMFSSIKGEAIEYLENTRTIPLMVGNRLLGVYYIEYTHQDVMHYVGLRAFIGSPQTFHQNMEMVEILEEEQEETLGRLIFGDIIKPLLDKNMDTKFLKSNQEILYTLKKLLEDNEISNSINLADSGQFNMYNLSRIIYIPAKELIFKRNGTDGLGRSKFSEAFVPANSAILGNEAYLTWLLNDGKGMTFLSVAKGLSENTNEYGMGNLFEQIERKRITRTRLRSFELNNYELTQPIYYIEKDPETPNPVQVEHFDGVDFKIDPEQIKRWTQEATEIVGYNSATFSSMDGPVELATKLYEMNDSKMLQIADVRVFKTRPASQLATALLRIRGGETYKNYRVEWIAPSIERRNDLKRGEIVEDIQKTFETYMSILDNLYGENKEYPMIQESIKRIILNKIATTDTVITSLEDIFEIARRETKVIMAENIMEEAGSKKKSKKEDSDEEEEEENEES